MSCEMPAIYEHSTPLARKVHTCDECRGVIQLGEKYDLHRGLWDGSWDTFKICEDCTKLRAEVDFGIRDYDERTPLGCLHERIGDRYVPEEMVAFQAIIQRRGGKVRKWLAEQVALHQEPAKEDAPR